MRWANPLVASALWTSRDGTMERDDHGSCLPGGVAPPAPNTAGVMRRWDPWVRSTIAVTELTNGLTYVATRERHL